MNPSVASEIIIRLTKEKKQCSFIQFFGGEPTLNLDAIEATIEVILDNVSMGLLKHRPRFSLVTNGVWINPDRTLELISKFNIETTVSLDGPPEIHNVLRPAIDASDTYNKVRSAISDLIKVGVPVAIESVYTALHMNKGFTIVDLFNFVQELGVNKLIFEPAYPPAPAKLSPLVDSRLKMLRTYYRAGVDWWFKHLVEGRNALDLYFKDLLLPMLEGFPSAVAQSGCPAGSIDITIGPTGDIFACYLLYGNPAYKLGNILSNQFMERIGQFPITSNDIDSCRACLVRYWCQPCAAINESWGNAWIAAPRECLKRQAVILRIAELAFRYLEVPQNDITFSLRNRVCSI